MFKILISKEERDDSKGFELVKTLCVEE